jgi:hypothetical protein
VVPIAASADCLPVLMPAAQRVPTIGRRPTGPNGEGLATQSAEPPAHPDPIWLAVMRLLAPFPVTDDRCLLTQRAPAWHLPQIDPRHPGTGLSSDSGSAIKRITAGVKACRRLSLARCRPTAAFTLLYSQNRAKRGYCRPRIGVYPSHIGRYKRTWSPLGLHFHGFGSTQDVGRRAIGGDKPTCGD